MQTYISDRPTAARKAQQGSTILEALLAATLIIGAVAFGSQALMKGMDTMRDNAAAEQLAMVQKAVDDYMRSGDRYAILAARVPSNGDSTPLDIRADLENNGFLPQGFSNSPNPFGDNYIIRVRCVAACGGDAPILESLVLTDRPGAREDDIRTARVRAPSIAARAGSQAAYTNGATLQGAFGGWSSDLSSWGVAPPPAGRLASVQAYDAGVAIADYLSRRAVPGHPEATTMFTDITFIGRADSSDDRDIINARTTEVRRFAASEVNQQPAGLNGRQFGDISNAGIVTPSLVTQALSANTLQLEAGNYLQMATVSPDPAGAEWSDNLTGEDWRELSYAEQSEHPDDPTDPEFESRYTGRINEDVIRRLRALHELGCPANQFIALDDNGEWECRSDAVRRNIVVAFDGQSCPSGWREFQDARGRFVVGAGRGPDGKSYGHGEQGGSTTVYLNQGHMPDGTWIEGSPQFSFARGGGFALNVRGGGQVPIDTMPRYIALTFCEKL